MLYFTITLIITLLSVKLTTAENSIDDVTFEAIQRHMDYKNDPCNNFFDYACGKWSNFHSIEYYSEMVGLLDYNFNSDLVNFLQSYNYGTNRLNDQVWLYYMSCRAERKKSSVRYLEIAKPSNELNWPLLEQLKEEPHDWPKEKFNWIVTLANLRRYGFNKLFIDESVVHSSSDLTEALITISRPTLAETFTLPNQTVVMVVLTEIGLSLPKAIKLAKKLMRFELKLKELLTATYMEDEGYQRIPLSAVNKYLPNWPWHEYFSVLTNEAVSPDFQFQIGTLEYFSRLEILLNQTDPELVCHYIMFHFVYQMIMDGSDSSGKIDCVDDLRAMMDLAVNFIYAEEYLENKIAIYERDVRRLVEVMRHEFRRKVTENRMRLTSYEQAFIIKKINKTDIVIGNLPKNVNYAFVEQYYNQIAFSRDNYHKNRLLLFQLRFQKEHESLTKGEPNADDYFFTGDSDTARSSAPFYLRRQNLIVVPYGCLQLPFFHYNMSDLLKYSSLGFVLAHEMMHGFDETGLYYFGADKSRKQNTGYNILSNRHFSTTLQCMNKRENYPNINEDIADSVGIRLAYDAYFNVSARNVTLLDKKMFFLNFAQFFCGMDNVIFVDHDSDKARLQKTLKNLETFAETFHCDLKDEMNPVEKCRLW